MRYRIGCADLDRPNPYFFFVYDKNGLVLCTKGEFASYNEAEAYAKQAILTGDYDVKD